MYSTELDARSQTQLPGDHRGTDKHCVFRSGQSWFSVPAVSVREISIAPQLVRLPNSHPSLAGVCHLRSEFIPVVMLNALIEVDAPRRSSPDNKLLVINGHSVWAMLIAEAAALASLETLVTPELRSEDANHSAVIGTAMFRDRIIRVLDPGRIFRLAQQAMENLWRTPQTRFYRSPSE